MEAKTVINLTIDSYNYNDSKSVPRGVPGLASNLITKTRNSDMNSATILITNEAIRKFDYLPHEYRPSYNALKQIAELALDSELYSEGKAFQQSHVEWLAGVVYDLFVEGV
tara:strand:+ start:684 stop:1016 length:333 start_codon:yes stop_codon:yes gene_type:complete